MNPDPTAPVPVTGIVDTRDDHALLRVDGYLPSAADAHISPAQLRRYGLRRGDLVTGAVAAAPRRGRHAALARLDTVNGMTPEQARRRR
ncbi:hypothetical protein ACL02O_27830, partial [Micromonospora sp. MS34]